MLIDFSNLGAIVGFFCGSGLILLIVLTVAYIGELNDQTDAFIGELNDQTDKRVPKNTRMTRFYKAKSIHRRGMTKNTTTWKS